MNRVMTRQAFTLEPGDCAFARPKAFRNLILDDCMKGRMGCYVRQLDA